MENMFILFKANALLKNRTFEYCLRSPLLIVLQLPAAFLSSSPEIAILLVSFLRPLNSKLLTYLSCVLLIGKLFSFENWLASINITL